VQVSLGTLIGQGITFFIFIYVTMKYVWPPIMKAMAERREKIADGLAAAERGKTELAAANARVDELVRKARDQAMEIVEQANRRAGSIVEDAKGDGERERERQLAAARAEIDQAIARARDELRGEIAAIAITTAEKILAREIDASRHRDILDKLATQI
jgi:F-type H+-transporting ATPase subunit b